MSILCQLFGHKPPASYSEHSSMGGGDYLRADHPYRDNIGRVHLRVYGNCPRCGCEYQVGMTHLHSFEKFMHLKDHDDSKPVDLPTVEFVGSKKCQRHLQAQGKPYPRTCALCGLSGPCKAYPRSSQQEG